MTALGYHASKNPSLFFFISPTKDRVIFMRLMFVEVQNKRFEIPVSHHMSYVMLMLVLYLCII